MFLILTHSQDYYTVDLVSDYLKKQGFECIRINTDEFPLQYQISTKFPENNSIIFINGQKVNLSKVKAIWLRKFWGPKIDQEIDERYRKGCYNETLATIKGLFYSLKHAFWMDTFDKVELANSKVLQLQLASKAGLSIPKTLITNNHKQLKDFFKENNQAVIAKMLTTLSSSMNAEGTFFYTTKLEPDDVENSNMLDLCPMIFQEEIQKDYELRVVYVDGNYFTGKLVTVDKLTDTRVTSRTNYKWESYQLPNQLKLKISALMQELNLHFGAIDIIKSNNNKYYFLEVNPTGEWGMLQKELNLPIAEAIAKVLLGKGTLNQL